MYSYSFLALHAIVNNAGVMAFGEFEWLTERLIAHQVNVNLLGTMKFTNSICPLIRQHNGKSCDKVINT